jgi:UDP-N-acetylmuramyl tripeptide synthase
VSIFPDPRLFAAILAARSAQFASRRLGTGGGSTIPGVVARRVDPGVLNKLSKTTPARLGGDHGTNGKTTTTGMISKILATAGVRAVNNSTGANLVTGVTAALVSDSSLSGKPTSEMGLFEVDEASVPRVAAEAELKILAVLNLFRDQLDRYGELAYTGKVIASAFSDLPRDGAVVLNADDPLVASLGRSAAAPSSTAWTRPDLDTGSLQHVADSKDCPVCGTPLDYSASTWATSASTAAPKGTSSVPNRRTGRAGSGSRAPAARPSPLDAEGRAGGQGLSARPLQRIQCARRRGRGGRGGHRTRGRRPGLGEFGGAFGRVERIEAGDREAFLLLIKNPVGFNEILRTFVTGADAKNVLIAINDNDADGRDVSWLWDVDFEMLADARAAGETDAAPFTVSGIRAGDMAVRLKYADLPVGPVIPDRREAIRAALESTPPGETLYVLPTYTAMLEIRKALGDMGYTHQFWEDG